MAQEQKKTLVVVEVGEVKVVGDKGAKKLPFKARDGEQVLSYYTFEQVLFPIIVKDATLVCDYDVTKREYQGDTYTDRKVTQVYQDGKPVLQKGFGGGFRGKSAEERTEIIRMAALKAAVELACVGKVEMKDLLPGADKFVVWIQKKDTAEEALKKAGLG